MLSGNHVRGNKSGPDVSISLEVPKHASRGSAGRAKDPKTTIVEGRQRERLNKAKRT